MNLEESELRNVKTLGVQWNVNEDVFTNKVKGDNLILPHCLIHFSFFTSLLVVRVKSAETGLSEGGGDGEGDAVAHALIRRSIENKC